ncbi:MAG: type II toxin-antitoxin system prevent-host-death family antitoxin [Nitrospinales bacterium]
MSPLHSTKTGENLEEILDRAGRDKERIIVRREGKEPVAVVPVEDVKLLETLEDKADLNDARTALKESKKAGAVSLSTLKKDLGLL